MIRAAKPTTNRNLRVRIRCVHRSYTVRKSKVATIKPCEKCVSIRANGTDE